MRYGLKMREGGAGRWGPREVSATRGAAAFAQGYGGPTKLAERSLGGPAIKIARRLRKARRLARAEGGQDLLEYGLLAALIAIFAVGAVTAVGQQIYQIFWQAIANNF